MDLGHYLSKLLRAYSVYTSMTSYSNRGADSLGSSEEEDDARL